MKQEGPATIRPDPFCQRQDLSPVFLSFCLGGNALNCIFAPLEKVRWMSG